MGIYVFRKELMCRLLREQPNFNDFGGEIIPAAAKNNKVSSTQHPGLAQLLSPVCWWVAQAAGKQVLQARLAEESSGRARLQVVAYLFNDYWEDIGTIKSFFEANLALAQQVTPQLWLAFRQQSELQFWLASS